MNLIRTGLIVILLVTLGCGEEVPRPAAKPLAASLTNLKQLYKWGPGPFPVQVAPELRLTGPRRTGPRREEALSVNVYYPVSATTALPVLVFSHGNFSNNNAYDNVISHWVTHGYVVVAPQHRDATAGYLSSTVSMLWDGNLSIIQTRLGDLKLVIDSLAEIERLVPELSGRLDSDRIGAVGHSFGAFNAQQLGGASALDTGSGRFVPARDERVKAVFAISPPGPMFDEITERSWEKQRTPTLMTTGTWDSNSFFWPQWQLHRLSFETALPGDQYALVIQGADHYLGNLICKLDLEEPPQRDALAMVNTLAIAFFDAYLKQDASALSFLGSAAVQDLTGGFAVLERR